MSGGKHLLGRPKRHIFGTAKVGEKGQIVVPRQVHFLAERVREAKVHELDIVVLDHLQNIRSGRHLIFLLEISR